MKDLTGYTNEWSVQPGDTLPFMVSCHGADSYEADIVRLICGDTVPDGPGVKEEVLDTDLDDEYEGREQPIYSGSYIRVPDDSQLNFDGGFTLQAYVYPTTPNDGLPRLGRSSHEIREAQGVLTKWDSEAGQGYGLFIDDDGRLVFQAGNGDTTETVRTDQPLEPDVWYVVGVSVDASDGSVFLYQEPKTADQHKTVYPHEEHTVRKEATVDPEAFVNADVPFLVAASAKQTDDGSTVGVNCYNGKISRPQVTAETRDFAAMGSLPMEMPSDMADAVVGAWDFADAITPDGVRNYRHVEDASSNGLHGTVVNNPVRGVTGPNWTGETHEFTEKPSQYAALHFHDDALADARWDVDFEWTVPDDLESGVYAARLRSEDDEWYTTFFVRPPKGTSTADVVFLVPTMSYLAYANDHMMNDDPFTELVNGHTPIMQQEDVFLTNHREYGISCYDTHTDGYGSFYSSRLRPLLTNQPKYKDWLGVLPSSTWQFPADLHLVDWLEEKEYNYDVVTDEDLHHEGYDLLEPYNVVITGTHPEYYSENMWTGLEEYQQSGGRLMYMGADGFYWQASYHPENSKIIEIRKGDTGIRGYNAPSGELCLSFNGTKGGLWRQRGMAPQKLVGVGFSAEGFDRSSYYRRTEESYDERFDFIFDGVDDEIIGDFGLCGHGAAGLELDRYDEDLGTPSHAHVLASSEDHTDNYMIVTEEILSTPSVFSGTEHPYVRADLVYFKTENEGGVFSTSSIGWCGSLSHNDYENNVSRITENVLDAFLERETLPR